MDHPMSAAQAQAFLVANVGRDVSDVSSIGHGEWSKTYAYGAAQRADHLKLIEKPENTRRRHQWGSA